MARRFPRSFFARPAVAVGPDLLGHVVARALADGTLLRARIVETEAYEPDDPASHAYRGRTARNAVMFGPPGHLYVYFTYGMHHCMNVVTGGSGDASAVLLRAGEPLDGLGTMESLRGTQRDRDLCRGPARWAQAFGVDLTLDGADLIAGDAIWLELGSPVPADRIIEGPRIGVTRATRRPWRFCVSGSRWLSRAPGARPSRLPS